MPQEIGLIRWSNRFGKEDIGTGKCVGVNITMIAGNMCDRTRCALGCAGVRNSGLGRERFAG
jgi:hypothetical protein